MYCNSKYRATHHLDSYILLTSKQKFPRQVGRYRSYLLPTQALSTFNLMSTEYKNQGAVSPCSTVLIGHSPLILHGKPPMPRQAINKDYLQP